VLLLAWELATAPDPGLRDGARAVRLARPVREDRPADVVAADVLAAALAESGDFAAAVEVGEQALAAARARGDHGPAQAISTRLARYRGGLPYHQ
jgi:hypothetical protein